MCRKNITTIFMSKISVIIPLYNKETTIGETLKSVLQQTFTDFEIIIVNDGSTDNSLSVVKNIHDSRIRVIDKTNEGVSATRNRGAKEARGEYLFFLDADDIIQPGSFAEFKRMLRLSPDCNVFMGSYIEKDYNGTIVKSCICKEGAIHNVMRDLWSYKFYPRMGNMFIHNAVIKETGLLRTDITFYEDFEWLLRLFKTCKLFCSSKTILEYKRNEEGLSSNLPPIDKDFSFFIKLGMIKDRHEKLILGDFLMRRILRRFLIKDIYGGCTILRNNLAYIPLMVRAYITRPHR